jgi:hypothetical protein
MNKHLVFILGLFISTSAFANNKLLAQQWQVANNNNAAVLSQDQGYIAEFSFVDGGVIISSTISGSCTSDLTQHKVADKLVTFELKQQQSHCSLIPKSVKDKAVVNSSFNRMKKVSFNNASFTTNGFHDALIQAEKIRFTGKNS